MATITARVQHSAARAAPAQRRGRSAARPSLRTRVATEEPVTFKFDEAAAPASPTEAPAAAAPKAPAPAAPARPVVPTASFFELMSFNGRPETINSRAAMIAFVAAVGAETSSRHPDVLHQFGSPGGFVSFLFVAGVVTAGTFMPEILRSARSEYAGAVDDSFNWTSDPKTRELGPFTAQAEVTNGRAAMMGLIALMGVESFTHTALFGFLG